MNGAVAVFVKTPDISPVKTRLASGLGKEKAIEIYKILLRHTEHICKKLHKKNKIIPYWAIAEKEQLDNPIWKNMNRIRTGEGGLGERMENVYNLLLDKFDYVILIGADCPQLSDTVLLSACNMLKTNKLVIGPCFDGGFYLFGGRLRIPSEIWSSTPYSQSNTKEFFCNTINKLTSINISELDTFYDIDTVEDLKKSLPFLSNTLQSSIRKVL